MLLCCACVHDIAPSCLQLQHDALPGQAKLKVAYQFQTAHTGPHSRSALHCASNGIAPADVLASVYCSGTRSEAADAAVDSTLVQVVPVEAVLPLANHCGDGHRPCTSYLLWGRWG